jgi:hypothetical protein
MPSKELGFTMITKEALAKIKGSPVIYDRGSGVFYAGNDEGTEYTQVGRSEVRTLVLQLKGTKWGNQQRNDMPTAIDSELLFIMRDLTVDGVIPHRIGHWTGDLIVENGQRYLVTGQQWPEEVK